MTKSRDRTEDFKDAVRISAISSGFTESKLALVMSSFIMHKPTHRLPFTKAALKTLESINELDHFILKHQKDYLNLHRTTEQERDNIEHEVSIFVKASKEQIDILKNRIHDEVKHENTTWLPMISDGSHADEVAHKHGVVLILSERLHSVTANFDKLRSVRIQDAINRAMPRRKKHAVPTTKSSEVLNKSDFTEVVSHEVSTEPTTSQNQTLEYETRALQVELTRLLDVVQETETKMVEMSALNHLMSVHVLQQAQQIELLYEQAVEATQNVELGNRELSQAIKRNSSSRTFLLLFFFVLTFSVIFLDWYS